MEENIKINDELEIEEIQSTFNMDAIEDLLEDGEIENVEEVIEDED